MRLKLQVAIFNLQLQFLYEKGPWATKTPTFMLLWANFSSSGGKHCIRVKNEAAEQIKNRKPQERVRSVSV